MIQSIISLKPTMRKHLDFDHDLMDEVGKGVYKLSPQQNAEVLKVYADTRNGDELYILTMSYLWLTKDLVCRFRAHFPSTIHMTDDLVSVGVEATQDFLLTKFKQFVSEHVFFKGLQAFIHTRMRAYINDNISAFGASRTTNTRRELSGQPLEYNFASEVNDDLMGGEVNDPFLIDILDSIEQLNDVDTEEMRDLVYQFLKQNHNISEEELTDAEREALEKLTTYVKNAGL